jgi:hypothetical protein
MYTDFSTATAIGAQIPKSLLTVLNQLYEVEQKLKRHDDTAGLGRNVIKMKDALGEEGYASRDASGRGLCIRLAYEDPMGQPFKETRTDLDATIAGVGTEDLVVVDVIKPIIRAMWKSSAEEHSVIVQKGIVIVESRKEQPHRECHN